jgi:hypothetical protein
LIKRTNGWTFSYRHRQHCEHEKLPDVEEKRWLISCTKHGASNFNHFNELQISFSCKNIRSMLQRIMQWTP